MKTIRALEQRLRAWCSFRDVAHATRALAAAQVLRWSGHASETASHLGRVQALAEHVRGWTGEPAPAGSGCALVAFGTDLGLCGHLNRLLAESYRRIAHDRGPVLRVVCGQRLADLLPVDPLRIEEPAPSSFAAAAALAERIDALVGARGLRSRLCIVGGLSVADGGRPVIGERWQVTGDEAELEAARAAMPRVPARFTEPAPAAAEAELLLGHARILHAACAAARTEAAVRLARMSRAHESAERRIAEQERDLRKARQESVTQEMLELRGGRPAERPPFEHAEVPE